jgi:hypothetical protein
MVILTEPSNARLLCPRDKASNASARVILTKKRSASLISNGRRRDRTSSRIAARRSIAQVCSKLSASSATCGRSITAQTRTSTCSTHTRAISRGINRSATNYTPTSAASSRNALTRESASTISASCRSADASPGNSYKIKPLPLTIGAFFFAFETKRGLYSPHRRTNRFTVGVLPAPLSPVARICGHPPDTIACYCAYRRMKPF